MRKKQKHRASKKIVDDVRWRLETIATDVLEKKIRRAILAADKRATDTERDRCLWLVRDLIRRLEPIEGALKADADRLRFMQETISPLIRSIQRP